MDPISTGAMIIGGAAKVGTAVAAGVRARKARKALKDLQGKPISRYTVDPKIKDMYEQAASEASAPRGFGGSTVSGFKNMLAKGSRGRFANAISTAGGSSSRGVNAVLAGQEGEALTGFTTANEGIVRGNRGAAFGRMGSGASQFQRTGDHNTSQDINYRMMLERALGEAASSNRDSMTSSFNSIGSDLISAGASGLMDSGYSTGKSIPRVDGVAHEVDPSLLSPQSVAALGKLPRASRFETLKTRSPGTTLPVKSWNPNLSTKRYPPYNPARSARASNMELLLPGYYESK